MKKVQFSRTGKPLCLLCMKLATHEGSYYAYRENGGAWKPSKFFFCATHAARNRTLPLFALALILEAMQDNVTPTTLRDQLVMEAGVPCTLDQAQDALWSRFPDRFTWSRAEIMVHGIRVHLGDVYIVENWPDTGEFEAKVYYGHEWHPLKKLSSDEDLTDFLKDMEFLGAHHASGRHYFRPLQPDQAQVSRQNNQ